VAAARRAEPDVPVAGSVVVEDTQQLVDGPRRSVLLVEADARLADLLGRMLSADGWLVRQAPVGMYAGGPFGRRPDVVVVDAGDRPEWPSLAYLRAALPGVPVLFLVSGDRTSDDIAGSTAAGDDFLVKPFSLAEAARRLRALARPAGGPLRGADQLLTVGDLSVDEDSREVRRGGREIALGAREFELLVTFMRDRDRVLTRAELLERVWSYDFHGRYNVVDCALAGLRKHLDAAGPPMIRTVRGVGYILREGSPGE
jgi:two-component system OmpR family response regulator